MYKICRTEKSLARQRELENGFLEYMESVSFFAIEITDLCRYLDIPRKTFYRYFGSREDALNALLDHRLMDMNRVIEENTLQEKGSLRQDVIRFFLYWKAQQRFLDILMRNNLGVNLMSRAMLQPNLSARLSEYLDQNRNPGKEYTVSFLVSGMMSILLQWHMSGYKNSPEELADIIESIFRNRICELLEYEH